MLQGRVATRIAARIASGRPRTSVADQPPQKDAAARALHAERHAARSAMLVTASFIALIGLAIVPELGWVAPVVLLLAAIPMLGFFQRAFACSTFFLLALANGIAVYACLFTFFATINFGMVGHAVAAIGFVLPLMGFGFGAWWRRDRVLRLITREQLPSPVQLSRVLGWLVPVFAIGAATFGLPGRGLSQPALDALFLASLALIGLIVVLLAPEVAGFLLDVGLLFGDFFRRMQRLIAPAFAFSTLWSLMAILFASLYRVLDLASGVPLFRIDGQVRPLRFDEALYFSVVTLTTVGYGDVTPVAGVARMVVAIQTLAGVLLLLFGFYELQNYARERRHPHPAAAEEGRLR